MVIRLDKDKRLKTYVEGKIFKNYMVVGNLSITEFKTIDDYCKEKFNDSRKQMVLSLIKYQEGDTNTRILDDKITLIYNNLLARIERVESALGVFLDKEKKPVEKAKSSWKGFN